MTLTMKSLQYFNAMAMDNFVTIPIEILRKFRENIPQDGIEVISKNTNFSVFIINSLFEGKVKVNDDTYCIIIEAQRLIRGQKEKLEAIKSIVIS